MPPALITLIATVGTATAIQVQWNVIGKIADWITNVLADSASSLLGWANNPEIAFTDEEKNRTVQEMIAHMIGRVAENIAEVNSTAPQVAFEYYPGGYDPTMGPVPYARPNDSRVEILGKTFTKIFTGFQTAGELKDAYNLIPIANVAEKIDNLMTVLDARLSFYDPEDERIKSLTEIVWEIANRPGGAASGMTFEEWKELLDSYFMVQVGTDEISISDLIISLLNHGNFLYF